jgi:hypothetical protein
MTGCERPVDGLRDGRDGAGGVYAVLRGTGKDCWMVRGVGHFVSWRLCLRIVLLSDGDR